MIPVLHTYTDARLASGTNRIPSSFSNMSPDPLPARSRSSGSRWTRSYSSEVFGERYPVGWLLARLIAANRRDFGRWDQEVAVGHGQAEVEGIALSLSESTS